VTSYSILVSGYLIAGYLVIGLFFVRFWRQAKDRLFGFFAFAFFLLAAQRALLVIASGSGDATFIYALRAFAFLIIIYAIVDKNKASA
jgi:hypothetical protein